MQMRPGVEVTDARRFARAEQIVLFGALALLLVGAGLGLAGAGAGSGGLGGQALRVHAEAGGLGWMTLGVLAVAAGMAAGEDVGPAATGRGCRLFAWLAVAVVVTFVAAGAADSAVASAGAGTAVLVVLALFAGWFGTVRWRTRAMWTVQGLGMGAALGVLVAGYGLRAAASWTAVAGDAGAARSLAGAGSAVLAVPFVVLAATAAAESAAARHAAYGPATAAGMVQVGLLVLAAAATLAGVLTSNLALTEANVPLLLAGIVIFLVRAGPLLLTAGWARGGRVWLVTSAVALAVDAGLFAHVVFEVGVRRYASAGLVPPWLVFTVDHVTFAGVGTAALLGAIAALHGRENRWPAADVAAAAGLVLGIAGIAIGLAVGSAVVEQASGTVLALAVLLAVGAAGSRVARLTSLPRG